MLGAGVHGYMLAILRHHCFPDIFYLLSNTWTIDTSPRQKMYFIVISCWLMLKCLRTKLIKLIANMNVLFSFLFILGWDLGGFIRICSCRITGAVTQRALLYINGQRNMMRIEMSCLKWRFMMPCLVQSQGSAANTCSLFKMCQGPPYPHILKFYILV